MIFFGGVLGLVALAVWIFCIIDALTTPAPQVRYLPKLAWVAIVIFLVDLGSLAWLIAGRPWNARAMTPGGRLPDGGSGQSAFGRASAAPRRRAAIRPTNPDDDDEFLAGLAKRNERRDDPPTSGGDGPQPV